MLERRKTHRWQIMRDARVKLDGEVRSVDCYIRDISYRGMQIASAFRLPQWPNLKMNVEIDNSLLLTLEAAVPWRKGEAGDYVYGLSFNRIRDEQKNEIYEYVCSHFPLQIKEQWRGSAV
ncbi:MAG: PilZ domain-containing protein [Candidatus Omnitrophica bacterium]|nr:PilZ domain-containing protein [Candidatus Omnitrophota bacterium]